jgi:hypothetical protein
MTNSVHVSDARLYRIRLMDDDQIDLSDARLALRKKPGEALACKSEPRRIARDGFRSTHVERDDRQKRMRADELAIRCVQRRNPRAGAAIVLRAGIAGRLIAIHGRVLKSICE